MGSFPTFEQFLNNVKEVAPALFTPEDTIFAYTRAQAIEDGLLVDVSETAREAGIRFPVALTRAAFEDAVTWTRTDVHQDERGRLWDVLWMLSLAMRRAPAGRDRVLFTFLRIPNEGRGHVARKVTFKAVCGPGDTAAPCITVSLPTED